MHQRRSGRPSGTDGSDFSYRMVVDSRYTKVAEGKKRLATLMLVQLVLVEMLAMILPFLKGWDLDRLTIASSAIGSSSFLIGEFGRRRSRVSFLRVYAVMSSLVTLLSLFVAVSRHSTLEVILNPSNWESKKFELTETFLLLLGFLVQIFSVSTVISLIRNMSPPKKAS
ncbi:hypothetical protein Tsubulata_012906 [Turnera subulata]|uniref:Uncharacterized protein n=1 Tax=Turnera subulata TaxID=218843 RepID=A0A9Q0J5C2_9ROSI|nr:hypothetical protein Tsubulata_012906 [Turnera subulata]